MNETLHKIMRKRIAFSILTSLFSSSYCFSQTNSNDSLISSISNHVNMIDSLIKCCEKDSFDIFHIDGIEICDYDYSLKKSEKRVLYKSTVYEKNAETNYSEYFIGEKVVALKVNRVKHVKSFKKIINKNSNYIKWWFNKFKGNSDYIIKPSKKQNCRINKQSIEAVLYFNNYEIIYYKDNQKVKDIKRFKKKILKRYKK